MYFWRIKRTSEALSVPARGVVGLLIVIGILKKYDNED